MPMPSEPHLALTYGEPAGIGPDLCLLLARQPLPCRLTVLGDPEVLRRRARQRGLKLAIHEGEAGGGHHPGRLQVLPRAAAAPVMPGRLNPANARHVLDLIETAVRGCLEGRFDALVTAPVHKGVINEAGIPFSGHTEFIAALTGGHPVMLLATTLKDSGRPLRVALATTHLPLRDVPQAITSERLRRVLTVLHHDLRSRFGIQSPQITVLGLNPHAGEGGHLGREETEIIGPLLAELRGQGLSLTGPLPADTAFLPERLARSDAFLAMYHDQGLPVLKFAGFGRAVNITLGLPVIRTSVDHGTALEKAGSSDIDCGSLEQAVLSAIDLARHAHPA
ncbi:4-hydroxythreonine-4-phosphate dehydrogenase [Methylomarinovum tepidoasis]|uniref:4-hydroxythreonine-4-phosphate dehydrogenase n=1 Tax=Methylomarinovum tepidoasis TaxID=2840183 RepID=A0AAU9CD46_9GAMM|nr:4-hydroxythreonine-4-phosphate dehydrogenase [Methylomarinovum sp. IN45]